MPEVRLVGPGGEQVGVVTIEDALRMAQEADLDLVEVAPNSRPPVVKIMDFGKFKYEAAQKAKEARRNQANTVLKEVRFRLKIDTHDYETKAKRAIGFLKQGDKVKAMILFRGREQSRPEMGVRLLQRFAEDLADSGIVEHTPTIDGRNMVMVIAPLKNKSEARADANAQRNVKARHEVDVNSKASQAVRPAGQVIDSTSDASIGEAAQVVEALVSVPGPAAELTVSTDSQIAPVKSAIKPTTAKTSAKSATAKPKAALSVPGEKAPAAVVKAPAVKKAAVKAPAVKKAAVKAPAVKKVAVKAPVAEKAAVKAPAVKKTATKPVTKTTNKTSESSDS